MKVKNIKYFRDIFSFLKTKTSKLPCFNKKEKNRKNSENQTPDGLFS